MHILNDYIKDVCMILKIQPPMIIFDTSHFASGTMLAQCSSDGSQIYLRILEDVNPDQMFAIAHELRHIWQIRTNPCLYLSDYRTVDEIGVDEYNSQLTEIDANAFAGMIMVDFFQIKPLWHGLSEKNIKKINERQKYILKTLNNE